MATRIARLSILDSYGVRWSHETFARDLMQNFFDSAADFRAITLDVRAEEGVVEIRGPETFDLDLLAYIGATTKTTGRTVGGFGEGFKICALIGSRDFGLTITAGSGPQEIAVFFDPVPLGRELCYRVTEREADPIAGSYVRLAGCDAACIAAFKAAPAMFRHPDNPRLQEPIVIDEEQGVAVYPAPEGCDGELYYRRQLRGRARFYTSRDGHPVTLAHDGIIDGLEGDRDRRDLPAQPVAYAVGQRLAPEALHRVLLHLMPYWRFGNEVLSGLLSAAITRKLRFGWPQRWLAKSGTGTGLNELAERQGFLLAMAMFAQVGMPTPDDHYTDLETRAATPLELARIGVVRDLYGELTGKPARTTKFEVFSTGGAAVAGQHLGDRVIVGAELIAKGFDAVSGTILHELAHETGGEEDIRFLHRLTLLLGAAIRSPEKVRAARRRYAAATPAPEAPPPEPAPVAWYVPELFHGDDDVNHGVVVAVVVPPAFPPTEAVYATIRAAAKEMDVKVWISAETVTGPVGAVTWGAPGLPTVIIGGNDVEPPAEGSAAPGYHLRTYGPDGLALCPDRAAIQAAIRQARDRKLTGRAGFAALRARAEGHRERVRAVLGIELPAPPSPAASARKERDDRVRAYFRGSIGDGEHSIGGAFVQGQLVAVEVWVRASGRSRLAADPLYYEILARLRVAVAHATTLRDQEPDFDDADAFERDAMGAAMGAAVASYAMETDESAAEARALAGFRAVRAATARALDLDVVHAAKVAILAHALDATGLAWNFRHDKRFDLEVFAREIDRAEAEAVRLQRIVDVEGGILTEHMVREPLRAAAQDPKVTRTIARNARIHAQRERASQAIRAAYDAALRASGSAVIAAARCLEEAARQSPEVPR